VGLCATAVALTIGVVYGTTSGFIGGKVDAVMMRIVDIIFALPFTVFRHPADGVLRAESSCSCSPRSALCNG
jgi:hypothetical protein